MVQGDSLKYYICSAAMNFSGFMEPEGSSPCLQKHVYLIGEVSQRPHFPVLLFSLILSLHLTHWPLSLRFYD